MKRVLAAAALTLLGLTSAGAQSGRTPPAAVPVENPMRVVDPLGGAWRVHSIGDQPMPPEARVFFNGGTDYATQVGCGNYGGFYSLDGERIRVRRRDPVNTSKCRRSSDAQPERALAAFIDAADRYAFTPDGTLRITARDGRTAVLRQPEAAIPAIAGRWRVERIGTETLAPNRDVRVHFDATGVSALAECNMLGGRVIPEGSGFRITDFMGTAMGCGPVREAFDARLGAAVSGARRYTLLSDGRLRLEGGREPLLLSRFRLPPAQTALPGSYKVCGSNPRGVMYDGQAAVTFTPGKVTDNAGCAGTWRADGARLALRLETSGACTVPPAPAGETETTVGDKRSVLAVLRPDAYAFDEEGRLKLRTRRGVLDLCRDGRRWFGFN